MKIIDATLAWGNLPVIGKKKEKWLFSCWKCGYQAVFILYEGDGMSTGCELCNGDMERVGKVVQKSAEKDDALGTK